MIAVRIIKWMVVVKNGLIFIEDCSILETLFKLSSDITVKKLKGIRSENIASNFLPFRMLKETGGMSKKKIVREFTECNEVGLDNWLSQNILLEENIKIIPGRTLLIRQIAEAIYWRILVNL
jgi:hypothetical protein